jgi:DNA-binding CsgD family transcriptional regulator
MAGMTERPAGPVDTSAAPRLALEGEATDEASVRALVDDLRSSGYRVRDIAPVPESLAVARSGEVVVIRVSSVVDAGDAVRLALRGFGLVVVGLADRATLDLLYDDLRRFGRLDVRTTAAPDALQALDAEERAVLACLAEGMTLGEAATSLHLSRRTADRRLSAARRKLGVATTIQALSRFRGSA